MKIEKMEEIVDAKRGVERGEKWQCNSPTLQWFDIGCAFNWDSEQNQKSSFRRDKADAHEIWLDKKK